MGKKERREIQSRLGRLYRRYRLLALNVFHWENLPAGIESRHIEEALFEHGQCFFFEDKELGYLCLRAANIGLNVYGDPTQIMVTGNCYTKQFPVDEGVRILNNDDMIPTYPYIMEYAERLLEVENSIIQNVKQQKFSWFAETDVNTEATMKAVYKKISEGEPIIYGKKAVAGNISYMNINTPFKALELNQYRKELENELLSFLGLNNADIKKERLLSDEVNANNAFIDRNVEIMYKNRKYAEEKINKMFGLDIRVVKKNDIYKDLEKSRGFINKEEELTYYSNKEEE